MNIKTNKTSLPFEAEHVHPQLRSFLDQADHSKEAIDRFVASVQTPLQEPGALTFLWRGEALSVQLLRWIHAGVDASVFKRIGASDLWYLRLPAKDGGRFEYKLNVNGNHGEEWILDPLNPHRAGDPFGENSVAMGYGYRRPQWSTEQESPRGTIEAFDIKSAVFDATRCEKVYLPYGYTPSKCYPLLIIHDGGDYDEYADLTVSLDNLIADGDIPPLIAVLVQADDRMSEYPRGRRHARYIVGDLLPVLNERFSLSEKASDRVLVGASLGAVASLATAFRYPGVFGGLVLKSGSFILDQSKLQNRSHPVFARVARLIEAVRRAADPPATRVFVSTGELEGLAEENRALAEHLRDRGAEVMFQSSWDGHHWHNWRDQLRDALMWVLRPE